jgi:sec-independent protein translocase protein TatA
LKGKPWVANAMVLQTNEIILIALVILLLFGAGSIPKLARSLGRAQGEFNKARKEFTAEAAKGEASVAAPASEDQVRRTLATLASTTPARASMNSSG